VTPLITPTATVCFMSLTANLPSGGYSVNTSTHMFLVGSISTIAQSPVLMAFGSSSNSLPVLLSILDLIILNLQAMCEVWQSSTGVYPFWIWLGWLRTMTWAWNWVHSLAGSFLVSEQTYPLLISLTAMFLTLNPTLSPGIASGIDSWCISTDLTSDEMFDGAKTTTIPGFKIPVSTLPTGTVPIPPIF